MSLGFLLLAVLAVLLCGSWPSWGYSRSWGYGPSSLIGVVFIIILVLLLAGRL